MPDGNLRCLRPIPNRSGGGLDRSTLPAEFIQRRLEMPDSPDHKDIWHELNQARLDIAELRGMVKMHFEDSSHHIPPCRPAADMQKMIMSSLAAAVVALLAAVGNVIVAVVK